MNTCTETGHCYNPDDIEPRECGRCHVKESDMTEERIKNPGEIEHEWQPISTAPRDGSSFVVIRPGAKKHHYRVVFYSGIFPRKPFKTYHGTYTDATHWIPLPKPPGDLK